MERSPRLLLCPFPITLFCAFGYFLLRHFGWVDPEVAVRYATSRARSAPVEMSHGLVWNLVSKDFPERLAPLIQQHVREEETYLLKRLLTFAESAPPTRKQAFAHWILRCSLRSGDPARILEAARCSFLACLEQGIDPWKSHLPVPEIAPLPMAEEPVQIPPDKRIGTIPIFKSHTPGEREVIATARYELREGRVWELAQTIRMVVGGPAGSGKSTVVASLAFEMKNILASLRTRTGWEGLRVRVEPVNLDLATPTLEAISAGARNDCLTLEAKKRQWSIELALEALDRFLEATEGANIVIGDLPGGTPDSITEIVMAPADVAILVTKDWKQMPIWKEYLDRLGITLVSQVRSHLAEEEFSSVVTTYRKGEYFGGRIVGLDRVDRSWDRFISWLAEFLLFDILPSFIEERRRKLARLLQLA